MRKLTILAGIAALLAMRPLPCWALLAACNGSSGIGSNGYPGITVTTMVFGTYVGSSPTLMTTNTIGVGCVGVSVPLLYYPPPFTISLSSGVAASFAPRAMAGPGSSKLSYNIYTTAALTTVWGDGTGGSVTQGGGGNILVPTYTFTGYGAIPTGQWVRAGSYSDTILVTVTY
jgi:spore coat protein U-like protein